LLLGVKGITVISHGRSHAYAIKNAVRVAKDAVESGVNEKIAKFHEE
jgi:glycerol-3-phosphate acyltransferase PlsX